MMRSYDKLFKINLIITEELSCFILCKCNLFFKLIFTVNSSLILPIPPPKPIVSFATSSFGIFISSANATATACEQLSPFIKFSLAIFPFVTVNTSLILFAENDVTACTFGYGSIRSLGFNRGKYRRKACVLICGE